MTATELPPQPKLVPFPAPVRDVMACYREDFDPMHEVGLTHDAARLYKAADAQERDQIVMMLAEISNVPRVAIRTVLDNLCFNRVPACDVCGAEAYLYEPLPQPGGAIKHCFHCRAHATTDREPTQWQA
jgi:hypothetical protein